MAAIDIPGQEPPKVPLSMGTTAGGFVFVSGQVASRPDGTFFVGDFEKEVEMTLDNVEAVLTQGGAQWTDVVKVQVYLSSAQLFSRFNEVYAARLGSHRPARTALIVGFAHPDVRVEVDAIAWTGKDAA